MHQAVPLSAESAYCCATRIIQRGEQHDLPCCMHVIQGRGLPCTAQHNVSSALHSTAGCIIECTRECTKASYCKLIQVDDLDARWSHNCRAHQPCLTDHTSSKITFFVGSQAQNCKLSISCILSSRSQSYLLRQSVSTQRNCYYPEAVVPAVGTPVAFRPMRAVLQAIAIYLSPYIFKGLFP